LSARLTAHGRGKFWCGKIMVKTNVVCRSSPPEQSIPRRLSVDLTDRACFCGKDVTDRFGELRFFFGYRLDAPSAYF